MPPGRALAYFRWTTQRCDALGEPPLGRSVKEEEQEKPGEPPKRWRRSSNLNSTSEELLRRSNLPSTSPLSKSLLNLCRNVAPS